METRPLYHPEVAAKYIRQRQKAIAFLQYGFFAFLVVVCFFALAGCGGQQASDGRTNLAKTEIAATAAFKEVAALANAGVIKKGSMTATIVADAELVVAAAIRVWRTDPDNPQYIAAGLNALPALIQLIADIKAGRK